VRHVTSSLEVAAYLDEVIRLNPPPLSYDQTAFPLPSPGVLIATRFTCPFIFSTNQIAPPLLAPPNANAPHILAPSHTHSDLPIQSNKPIAGALIGESEEIEDDYEQERLDIEEEDGVSDEEDDEEDEPEEDEDEPLIKRMRTSIPQSSHK
jgi:hypothetical protein